MSGKSVPSSAWMAGEFVNSTTVRWYAEDVFVFEKGLFRPVSRQWLKAQVQNFLIDALGAEKVEARYVADCCESVKNRSYLDDRLKPPFWIAEQREANVIVASNDVVLLDPLLDQGKVRCVPHTPDLFALCGIPDAFDSNAECPKWIEFVRWMTRGNEEEVRLLQQFCAWTFIAKRLNLERILWLCGPGRNGKSTFLKIVRYVIGESATSAVGLDAFSGGENFRLWPTLHKLANFCNDAQVKKTSNVASLNAFVSGDPFTVNRKFREQLTIQPSTVCYFASNPMPLYNDASDAFWRRLLLIHCRQRLSEEQTDPGLVEDLKAEAAGVLNWMLAPIPHLLAQKRFDIPQSVRDNVEALKAEVNAARQFIREKIQPGDPERDSIMKDHLLGLFSAWCDTNGLRREALPVVKEEMRLAFNVELTRRRKGLSPGERVLCWMGVKWKPEENVKMPDLLTRHNDYLQSLVQQREAELARLQADKDAEIAQLRAEVQRLQAKLAPPPPPVPPKPREKGKRAAPSMSPEEFAKYLERCRAEANPVQPPAEDAELVAKLTSLEGHDAASADTP